MLAGCLGITIRPVWSPDGKIDTQLNKLLCLHQSEAREMSPDWPGRITHPAVCSRELGKTKSTHSTLWTLLAYLLRQRGSKWAIPSKQAMCTETGRGGFTRLTTETSQMTHDSWLEKYWEGLLHDQDFGRWWPTIKTGQESGTAAGDTCNPAAREGGGRRKEVGWVSRGDHVGTSKLWINSWKGVQSLMYPLIHSPNPGTPWDRPGHALSPLWNYGLWGLENRWCGGQ